MTGAVSLFAGTLGAGLWRSFDGGAAWEPVRQGLTVEARVYCLAGDPHRPGVLYAGTAAGIVRSRDGGRTFAPLPSPMDGMEVWRIAVHPGDPSTLLAGTRPAALFASSDEGATWRSIGPEFPAECPAVRIPRVTAISVNPLRPEILWVGVEVDGVHRSLDAGLTWQRMDVRMGEIDIHDIVTAPGGRTIVSTPGELFATDDDGESWRRLGVQPSFAYPYCRGLSVLGRSAELIHVAAGEAALGSTGAIQRSTDGGLTWSRPALPMQPNSPMWAFATDPALPGLMLACSHYGELLISSDAGESWRKLPREFTQTRAIALLAQ